MMLMILVVITMRLTVPGSESSLCERPCEGILAIPSRHSQKEVVL